jgi:hypothetical protein
MAGGPVGANPTQRRSSSQSPRLTRAGAESPLKVGGAEEALRSSSRLYLFWLRTDPEALFAAAPHFRMQPPGCQSS